jgi:pyruvate kinase
MDSTMFLRRTKIVATLGPATDDADTLWEMCRAGLDVARVNFSHGTQEDHLRRIELLRTASLRAGRYVGILADLSGPKIRIESFREGPVKLVEGAAFALDTALDPKGGTIDAVGVAYKALPQDVRHGDTLLLNDGLIVLEVTGVEGTRIDTRVVLGGELSNRKGVNRKGGGISAPALTDKDRTDIRFAAQHGLDYLALSFVRDAKDVNEARKLLLEAEGHARIIAKIERHEAVDNLNEIIDASDGVMVARGDLGVEMGYAALTGLQKTIIHEARGRDRVVITATQMMESMITNPVPTRAEVSDVANAVMDGTDAVMLSAESATGKYPVKAVAAMAEVIEGAERYQLAHERTRHRVGHRDLRDVYIQSRQGEGHRRAHRVGLDADVHVAHPLRYPDLRVHPPRDHAPACDAVSRRVSRVIRRQQQGLEHPVRFDLHAAAERWAGRRGRPRDPHEG